MDRRHQVFISSTFTDLIDERREVIEALLEMDAIPAGMELFAAGNTDQWTLIQQVIDQSDYYLVIVGGRYGSVTAEGISYTEMEYDYAIEKGIPVMGFVHADPDSIPKGKSEMDPETSQKLQDFRAKVQQKIVRSYSTPAELGGVVSRGLIKLQKDFPQQGWVRGDLAMTPETEARMSEMRAEIAELRQAVAEGKASTAATPKIEGLASGNDDYELAMKITGTHNRDKAKPPYNRTSYLWNVEYTTTWNDILQWMGPSLMDEASEREITSSLESLGLSLIREQPDEWPDVILDASSRKIASTTVDDVLVQLFALGLITRGIKKRTMSDHNRYWALTPAGEDQVMKLRAIRKPTAEQALTARREVLENMTVPNLKIIATQAGATATGTKAVLIDAILAAEAEARSAA